jgi:hypothetical protein
MAGRPRSVKVQEELQKVDEQFEKFDENVKEMTKDHLDAAPIQETEPQTRLSQKEIEKSDAVWLKPKRSLSPGVCPKTQKKEVFNEKFRKDYEYSREYVQFIAENKEIPGEVICDIWTKPFGGTNCESWDVPVGIPVWGPRHLAEQIKRRRYTKIVMDQSKQRETSGFGTVYGVLQRDVQVQRLDATPVSDRKSIFMGASNF